MPIVDTVSPGELRVWNLRHDAVNTHTQQASAVGKCLLIL